MSRRQTASSEISASSRWRYLRRTLSPGVVRGLRVRWHLDAAVPAVLMRASTHRGRRGRTDAAPPRSSPRRNCDGLTDPPEVHGVTRARRPRPRRRGRPDSGRRPSGVHPASAAVTRTSVGTGMLGSTPVVVDVRGWARRGPCWLLVLLLVTLNAAFAGSELALVSRREGQLHRLQSPGWRDRPWPDWRVTRTGSWRRE
jgi:hypothetical protein